MNHLYRNRVAFTLLGAIFIALIPFPAQAAVPTAPRSVVGIAGNGYAKITFRAPSPNANITNYKFSIDSGTSYTTFSPGQGSSTYEVWGSNYSATYYTDAAFINVTNTLYIFGLTPGTTYNINLIAVNAEGDSPASATVAVTPTSGLPYPPGFMSKLSTRGTFPVSDYGLNNLVARYQSGNLIMDFAEPPNGGSPIDYYQYSISLSDTLTEAAVVWQDFATPSPTLPLVIPLSDLNYTSVYYLYLRSHNANGFSAYSKNYSAPAGAIGHSVGFARPGLPARPSITGVTRSGSDVIISFNPGSDGGYAITDYLYSTDNVNYTSAGTASSPLTVPGAATNSVVTIFLKAVNSIGISPGPRSLQTGPLTATQSIASRSVAVSATVSSFTPVTASRGTSPYSFAVSPSLPSGLSMNSSTGAITGTPSVASSATTYTVTVTDASSETASNTFSLTVASVLSTTLAIPAETLTAGAAAITFTPVPASGGTSPITYAISPSLPSGLSMSTSTGAITGTPASSASATNYTVTATDATSATSAKTFSLTIATALSTTLVKAVETITALAAASFTPVTASGGEPARTFSISPSLPSGLSLNTSTGVISGTATAGAASTNYTVTATDSNSATSSKVFALVINGPLTATQAIASTTLTNGTAATSFTPVTGSGGTSPLSYAVSPGLPSGLSMSSSTGAITGTPATSSSATTYTVTVTDSASVTATNTFSLAVSTAVSTTLARASETLTAAVAATSFIPVTASGGTSPITFSISPSLPAGLSMNTATGVITGTPTSSSARTNYTVTATDANGATSS
ncbi:MAG: putative Ig domain-containing protein, partial [Actinobacteria bacterium]|nr:putative Ig domain-containing protein [Actinomycetota bacterium]